MTTLTLEFQKKTEGDDETKYDTFSSNSKAETIINESDIDEVFETIYILIKSKIQKSLRKKSGWITDLVIDHNISINRDKPLAGSSYIKLPNELNHPRKGLINI